VGVNHGGQRIAAGVKQARAIQWEEEFTEVPGVRRGPGARSPAFHEIGAFCRLGGKTSRDGPHGDISNEKTVNHQQEAISWARS